MDAGYFGDGRVDRAFQSGHQLVGLCQGCRAAECLFECHNQSFICYKHVAHGDISGLGQDGENLFDPAGGRLTTARMWKASWP